MLDDISYIQEIKHQHGNVGNVVWQQYDILLAAQHYDWWTMVDWAAYMESADINMIESVVVADLAEAIGTELVHMYNQDKVGLKNFEKRLLMTKYLLRNMWRLSSEEHLAPKMP